MIRILLSSKLGAKKWTQAYLARKTGIRPGTINDLYHELADRVSLSQLEAICEALECEPGDLIVRDRNTPPENNSTPHYIKKVITPILLLRGEKINGHKTYESKGQRVLQG